MQHRTNIYMHLLSSNFYFLLPFFPFILTDGKVKVQRNLSVLTE